MPMAASNFAALVLSLSFGLRAAIASPVQPPAVVEGAGDAGDAERAVDDIRQSRFHLVDAYPRSSPHNFLFRERRSLTPAHDKLIRQPP